MAAQSAFSGEQPPLHNQKELEQEIAALEKTISLLSHEQERESLLRQLQNILITKKALLAHQSPSDMVKPKELPLPVNRWYQESIPKVQDLLTLTTEKYHHWMEFLTQLKASFEKKINLFFLLDIFLKLGFSLLTTLSFWLLLRKLIHKWQIFCQKTSSTPFNEKTNLILSALFLDSYRPGVLLFFTWLLSKLMFRPSFASACASLVGIWFIYLVLKSLCRSICSLDLADKRIIPINDRLAQYTAGWSYRFLLFTFLNLILIKISSLLDLKPLSSLFSAFLTIGLLIMSAIILVQKKEALSRKFSLLIQPDDPPWINSYKGFINKLSHRLYLFIILFFSMLVFLNLFGYTKSYYYLLFSSLKTLPIIGLTFLLWSGWHFLFKKMHDFKGQLTHQHPILEKQLDQYTSWLHLMFKGSILFLAMLLTISVWSPDFLSFLLSHQSTLLKLIRLPLIVLVGLVSYQVASLFIQKLVKYLVESKTPPESTSSSEIEKRMTTIGSILHKTLLLTVCLLTALMLLNELGFSIGPLLAGAGIIGVAVGFGSQNLVKDIISGLFMIIENQVRVGDVAILNGTGGLVEDLSLRTTVLRGIDGTVHIFPNGTITTVSNMTHDFSYYVFELGVAYKEDVDHVCTVLQEVGDQICQEEPYKSAILAPLEILGLDKFTDSAMIIKARLKTKPIKQWEIGREMNRRIKKRFDKEGIEIPFPHRTILFDQTNQPLAIAAKGFNFSYEELQQIIQQTVKETLIKETAKMTPKKENIHQ